MTATVEGFASRFGKEMALYCVRRYPFMLRHDFATLMSNFTEVQQMLGLREVEMTMLIRKNPNLLAEDASRTRERFRALPHFIPFDEAQASRQPRCGACLFKLHACAAAILAVTACLLAALFAAA